MKQIARIAGIDRNQCPRGIERKRYFFNDDRAGIFVETDVVAMIVKINMDSRNRC